VGKGRRDTVTPVNRSHRFYRNGHSTWAVCDYVNVIAGQESYISSTETDEIFLPSEMNDALSL
jgi:hypothetical protein